MVKLLYLKKGDFLFPKKFYIGLKYVSFFFIFLIGTTFIYSLLNLALWEIIVIGFILILAIIICYFLLKYYGNAIISFKIEIKHVIFTNAKGHSFILNKSDCTYIIDKPNRIIIKFINNEKFYINKYYFFNKKFFDFSEFNKENFKFAFIDENVGYTRDF